jgi:glycerol-3-phosphate cytidylyltransferase-like family protein
MEDEMKNFISRTTLERRLATLFWVTAFVASFTLLTVPQLAAQQTSQKTFQSPGHAANALYTAVKSGDTNQLMVIFGPSAKPLLSSGDPVADKNDRAKIVEKYDQMHRLVIEPDKTVTIYMGAENWPFPIPLVQNTKGAWYFDTEKGKKEVLFRRIGRNENSTIDTLQSLAEAQKEYGSELHDGATVRQYAPKIMSDEGKHNGLYWKPVAGEPQSPIGPLIAEAAQQGYQKKGAGPTPFHGYIYRVLDSQGKDAPGGAMSFMHDGKLVCGFAILAYPAEYRNSGVMTFMVGKDGQVYQKDLGPRTSEIANAMTEYNPDKSWSIAE